MDPTIALFEQQKQAEIESMLALAKGDEASDKTETRNISMKN